MMTSKYNLVDARYGVPSETDLAKAIAPKVSGKWNEIGIVLDVSHSSLSLIASKPTNQGNPNLCLMDVFRHWKDDIKHPYNWSTILKVLEHELVASKRVAEEICNDLLPSDCHDEVLQI